MTFRKRLARLTRSFRQTPQTETRAPFKSDATDKYATKIAELEAHIQRVEDAFSRHVPQTLTLVSTLQSQVNERRQRDVEFDHWPPAIEARLSATEHAASRVATGWDQHLPRLLDALSIANSEARLGSQAHDRIDDVRRDLEKLSGRLDLNLIDLKNQVGLAVAASSGAGMARQDAQAQIVTLGAVSQALSNELRLYYCGGEKPKPGFINIDAYLRPGVDIVAPPGALLPFGEGLVNAISVASDVRLGDATEAAAQFAYWHSMLTPGGRLEIHRLDLAKLVDSLQTGVVSADAIKSRLSDAGSPVSPGPQLALLEMLTQAGFKDAKRKVPKDVLGEVFEATKPTDRYASR